MTAKQAKSIGGKQLVKAATFVFVLYEVSLLYSHTQGDFANGLLFFIDAQMNGYFITFILLFFITMFLAGRQAGYNILLKDKKFYSVVFVGAFVSTILTLAFFEIAMLLISYSQPQVLERSEILETFFVCFIVLLIVLILAWLWAVRKIKLIKTNA